MDMKTVIGLNGCGNYDDGVYISPEDIDYAHSFIDEYKNHYTIIHTKAGNEVKVLGNAYHILEIKERKDDEYRKTIPQ
jgi:hypothetical protein